LKRIRARILPPKWREQAAQSSPRKVKKRPACRECYVLQVPAGSDNFELLAFVPNLQRLMHYRYFRLLPSGFLVYCLPDADPEANP
jgi:hypothetical protein